MHSSFYGSKWSYGNTTSKGPGPYKSRYYYDETIKDKKVPAKQGPTDYAHSLIDPWSAVQPRIPDLSCYPTAVAREEAHFTWTVDTSGTATNAQILVVELSEYLGYFYCQGPAGASAGGYNTGTLSAKGIGGDLVSRFDKFRVVSAGARVRFADNDSATKGVIYAITIPGTNDDANLGTSQGSPYVNCSNLGPLDLSTDAQWAAQKGVYMGPLVHGAVARYQPNDAFSFTMVRPYASASTAQITNYGKLIFYVTGLANGTILQVDIVANIEAIPVSNNIGIAVAPSPTSTNSLEAGLAVASGAENTFGNNAMEVDQNVTGVLRYLSKLKV